MSDRFELVTLNNGTRSIRSREDGETFHPVAGPVAEAEALYVRQLRLQERAARHHQVAGKKLERFVIWDVGLGAGGNVLTTLQCLKDTTAELQILSFDRTTDALRFALQHSAELQFPLGFEGQIGELLERGSVEFQHEPLHTRWEICLGDFPSLLAGDRQFPAPHAIFFDAFSPARNPDMWTLPLFENIFRRLKPNRPSMLATFSRSTMARVAMLLAGFHVGVGKTIAGKEETTIAANSLDLMEHPLDVKWVERVKISRSAEPMRTGHYQQSPITDDTWEKLRRHPQFMTAQQIEL